MINKPRGLLIAWLLTYVSDELHHKTSFQPNWFKYQPMKFQIVNWPNSIIELIREESSPTNWVFSDNSNQLNSQRELFIGKISSPWFKVNFVSGTLLEKRFSTFWKYVFFELISGSDIGEDGRGNLNRRPHSLLFVAFFSNKPISDGGSVWAGSYKKLPPIAVYITPDRHRSIECILL